VSPAIVALNVEGHSAPSLEAAEQALEAFSQTWAEVIPSISRQ
jgi:hypothetical protein